MAKDLDILAVGNAIVDVIAQVDDSFLHQHNLPKGTTQVVDETVSNNLYAHLPNTLQCAGGTSANSMVGVVALGGKAGFIGHVRDDTLGEVFAHSMEKAGVDLSLTYSVHGPGTGRCLVMVTPDADRTMRSCLGVADMLSVHNLSPQLLHRAKVIYLESYLFNSLAAKQANEAAAVLGREFGCTIALNLSAPFCVDQYRLDLLPFIEKHVDVLISNEQEILRLLEVDSLEEQFPIIQALAPLVVVTQGHKGAMITSRLSGEIYRVDRRFVDNLVDTTGAGDQFAAGFLYGQARGWALPLCGQIGTLAASEILTHLGGRPVAPLKNLIAQGVHKTIEVTQF